MTILKTLFWFSLIILAYAYIGYAILLTLLVRLKEAISPGARQVSVSVALPEVTLVMAAFNEEDFIEKKIQNCFELDYPRSLLTIIFITDGSTDRTPDIIRNHPELILLHQAERRGKVAAMNRAMGFVKTPIVIFSDANTLLNKEAIREIVKHYEDPAVGGVAGEKKIIETDQGHAAEAGEGLYWKYESYLKKMDSAFYSVVGAAGELFSVRKELFEYVAENMIIEDFVQSLKICLRGYLIRYEPNAYAIESSSASIKEEEKRKIRICAGAFQAMAELKPLFNVFRYPVLSFQFISHRVLRWTLCPVCLILLLATNLVLVIAGAGPFYQMMLGLQILFYGLAVLGRFYAHKNIKIKVLYFPYYFVFMNISVFLGFGRFIRKRQTILWEKASRNKLA